MYFPELARGREGERKIQEDHEMEDRQKAHANKIMKVWKIKKTENTGNVQSRGRRRRIMRIVLTEFRGKFSLIWFLMTVRLKSFSP